MDNFRIIYRVLKILEKAMDYEEFDNELLSAEALNVTPERRNVIFKMLLDNGYVEGISEIRAIGMRDIKLRRPQITLKGLEYLEENSLMQKAADFAKGAISLIK